MSARAVVSVRMRCIVSRPVDWPLSDSLKTSATASSVKALRSVASISAEPIPSATYAPTTAPMLLPPTQSIV